MAAQAAAQQFARGIPLPAGHSMMPPGMMPPRPPPMMNMVPGLMMPPRGPGAPPPRVPGFPIMAPPGPPPS